MFKTAYNLTNLIVKSYHKEWIIYDYKEGFCQSANHFKQTQ